MRSAFWGSLDLEQKSSADNQVKRICACTSERTKIAIRQLTSGEFMQSIKDEIFASNYSTSDSRTIPPSLRDSYLTTPVSLIGGDKPLRQLAFVGLRFVKTTLSCFYSLTFTQGSLLPLCFHSTCLSDFFAYGYNKRTDDPRKSNRPFMFLMTVLLFNDYSA